MFIDIRLKTSASMTGGCAVLIFINKMTMGNQQGRSKNGYKNTIMLTVRPGTDKLYFIKSRVPYGNLGERKPFDST